MLWRLLIVAFSVLIPFRAWAEDLAVTKDFQSKKIEMMPYYSQPVSEKYDILGFFDEDFDAWETQTNKLIVPAKIPNERERFFVKFRVRAAEATRLVLAYEWNSAHSFIKLFRFHPLRGLEEWSATNHSAPVWTPQLEKGDNEFIMLIEIAKKSSLKRTIVAFSVDNYLKVEAKKHTLQTTIYGVAGALIFFNLCMFILYRKSYLIYYILYSSTTLFILMVGSWHIPLLDVRLWNFALFLSAVASVMLSVTGLQIRDAMPKVASFLTGSCIALTLIFIAVAIFPIPSELLYFSGLGICAIAVLAALIRMMQGYVPAFFFALGWSILIAGFALNYLSSFTDKTGQISDLAVYYAYTIENLLFAGALAFRIHQLESQANQAKAHVLSQLEKVVYQHQVKGIEKGMDIESTMPTGQAEAVVIYFNISDSSSLLQHEMAKKFLQHVFKLCNNVMMEGYDGTSMRSQAYRVREFADGFLCSVGYPFESTAVNIADSAVEMAHRFYQILQEEAIKLDYKTRIRCGIGIAMGQISGFYPESGTKEYDLYGRAIILATRYEGMRKALFRDMQATSIIVVQERVMVNLSQHLHTNFREYNTLENGVTVRDDPLASKLYYLDLEAENAWQAYAS